MVSVALSVTLRCPAVNWYPSVRSPDFPHLQTRCDSLPPPNIILDLVEIMSKMPHVDGAAW